MHMRWLVLIAAFMGQGGEEGSCIPRMAKQKDRNLMTMDMPCQPGGPTPRLPGEEYKLLY